MQDIHGAGCFNIQIEDGCSVNEDCGSGPSPWIRAYGYSHRELRDGFALGRESWGKNGTRTACIVYYYDNERCESPMSAIVELEDNLYLYGDTCRP